MKLPALLLLPLLLMGGAAGVCGKQGKATSLDEFMEEVRGALAGHWELLQNLRYHTLGIKVRLVQLEAQIQNLSEHLNAVAGSLDAGELRERLVSNPTPISKLLIMSGLFLCANEGMEGKASSVETYQWVMDLCLHRTT